LPAGSCAEVRRLLRRLVVVRRSWRTSATHYRASGPRKRQELFITYLELDTATELLYRKAGQVTWAAEQITVVFEPYRYPEQQQAMVETCRRCNAAELHWRDGRTLRFEVAAAT
ncbi:MAG: hypothetical protein NT169_25265, partial [Chloroflexi bacterium]|nr:hypothetical protein [Chloroflexota bacterium]